MSTSAIDSPKKDSELCDPRPQKQSPNVIFDPNKYSAISLWNSETIHPVFNGLSLSGTANGNIDYLFMNQNDQFDESKLQMLPEELVVSEKMSCSVCKVTFTERSDQLLHFKLDWHCENLRRHRQDKEPIVRELFALEDEDCARKDAGNADEENNESSNSDLSVEDDNVPSATSSPQETLETLRKHFDWKSKLFFENGRGDILAIYKCLVLNYKETTLTAIEMVKRTLKLPNHQRWAVLLLGSGHFAAAIYNEDQVVVHKTIHRYVTRAKQGTSQGLHDHHSHAKSAGANLRRHNERSLIVDLQDLLNSWEDELDKCSHIFYKVSARSKSSLFGGKNPPLKRQDLRLRSIPFQTKKPTFKETEAVRRKLATLEYFGDKANWLDRIPCRSQRRLETSSVPASPRSAKENRGTWRKKEVKVKDESNSNKSPTTAAAVNNEGRRQSRNKEMRQLQEFKNNFRLPDSPQDESESSDEAPELLEFQLETIQTSDLDEFGGVNLTPKWTENKNKKSNKNTNVSGKKASVDANKLGKDEEILRDALYTSCCTNNLEKVQSLLCPSASLDADRLKLVLNSKFGRERKALLHVVSKSGFKQILYVLLENGADPGLTNGKGELPYTLAADLQTRNTYRHFRAAFPDRYNYDAARIPFALTKERQDEILEKRRLLREQKRNRDYEYKMELNEKTEFLSLAETQKVKVVSEQSVKLRCFQCGELLKQKIPFEYLNYKFCTVKCVKLHRQVQKS